MSLVNIVEKLDFSSQQKERLLKIIDNHMLTIDAFHTLDNKALTDLDVPIGAVLAIKNMMKNSAKASTTPQRLNTTAPDNSSTPRHTSIKPSISTPETPVASLLSDSVTDETPLTLEEVKELTKHCVAPKDLHKISRIITAEMVQVIILFVPSLLGTYQPDISLMYIK